jgi:hypothetical protein
MPYYIKIHPMLSIVFGKSVLIQGFSGVKMAGSLKSKFDSSVQYYCENRLIEVKQGTNTVAT